MQLDELLGGTRLVTRSEALGWFADAAVATPELIDLPVGRQRDRRPPVAPAPSGVRPSSAPRAAGAEPATCSRMAPNSRGIGCPGSRAAARYGGGVIRYVAVDDATMRALERHETRAHAIPGREVRDLGHAVVLHDPRTRTRSGTGWRASAGPTTRRASTAG